MNKVILIGRLARDPEVRYTQAAEPMAICRFAIAVDRPYSKNKNENGKTADFLNCVCFGTRAENISKFLKKGNRIAVTGRIQTGEYTDQQGNKRYTTDIVVENFEFVETKNNAAATQETEFTPTNAAANTPAGFYEISNDNEEYYEDELPF